MSDSIEYKAFIDCYNSVFIHVVQQSPQDVCDQLRSRKLLAPQVISYVNNGAHDDRQKASKICDSISNQIKINSKVVYLLIDALEQAGEWTQHAVTKFNEALQNLKQKECIELEHKISKPINIQEKCEFLMAMGEKSCSLAHRYTGI